MSDVFKGIAVSPGIAVGRAFVLMSEKFSVPKRPVAQGEIAEELARFERALAATTEEIMELRKSVAEHLDEEHAHILDAHLLVLEDVLLIRETMERVEREKVCVEHVFSDVLEKLAQNFEVMDDQYLRERTADVRDVGRRVLRKLLGKERRSLADLEEDVIVIAYDLSPSDTALMHQEKVIAFATDVGSRTSHTAIMARSLEIPAVVGLKEITRNVRRGDTLIVDGSEGTVLINPTGTERTRFARKKKAVEVQEAQLRGLRDLPAQTLDGRRVRLAANIELAEELPSVISHGAEGIGLYRTEFFYLNRKDLPGEDEQYEAYRAVGERVAPHWVTIRTMDLGGDKFASHMDMPHEMNPFLGWRAIRFCLERPEIFKIQLRAILRASTGGRMRVMFPLISDITELVRAKGLLEESREELGKRGIGFDAGLKIGAMIETPSAAMTADVLAREVDFFSIGTNDLIQYSLAVDRVNEKIAHLYEPGHPAVLRLIKNVIDCGHREGIDVAMCGEMAGESAFSLVLLGMGLDEFSMSPVAIPTVKRLIRSVSLRQAKVLAREVLDLPTSERIGKRVGEFMHDLAVG